VTYETAFDLQGKPFDFGTIAGPVTLSLIGSLLFVAAFVRLRQARRGGVPPGRLLYTTAFFFVWASFAVLATTVGFASLYSRHRYLQHRMQTGQVTEVEGIVTNFDPMPSGGHKSESFCVARTCFRYSDFDLTGGGFKNTSSHGGPIRPGLKVRITHVDNTIVRLQIANAPPRPEQPGIR